MEWKSVGVGKLRYKICTEKKREARLVVKMATCAHDAPDI